MCPSLMHFPVTEHLAKSSRHSSFYLASGPETGPLIVFVHGWPDLGHGWRHQLRSLAALGFRCVAPDMRGYGRSSIYGAHADYAVEHSVHDMLDLLVHLGRDRAIWVGHDWGSAVVWGLASHHPERCHAVASLCIPYIVNGFALANLIPLVNRKTYPESAYPAGQWEYWLYHQEHFDCPRAAFEANVDNFVRVLFRRRPRWPGQTVLRVWGPPQQRLVRRSGRGPLRPTRRRRHHRAGSLDLRRLLRPHRLLWA